MDKFLIGVNNTAPNVNIRSASFSLQNMNINSNYLIVPCLVMVIVSDAISAARIKAVRFLINGRINLDHQWCHSSQNRQSKFRIIPVETRFIIGLSSRDLFGSPYITSNRLALTTQ